MANADLEVNRIVRGRDLDSARAKRLVYGVVADDDPEVGDVAPVARRHDGDLAEMRVVARRDLFELDDRRRPARRGRAHSLGPERRGTGQAPSATREGSKIEEFSLAKHGPSRLKKLTLFVGTARKGIAVEQGCALISAWLRLQGCTRPGRASRSTKAFRTARRPRRPSPDGRLARPRNTVTRCRLPHSRTIRSMLVR